MDAQITEVLIFVFLLVGISFILIFSFMIYNKIFEKRNLFGEGGKDIVERSSKSFAVMDAVFVFIFGSLSAGLIISSFFIRTHPIFFFFFVIANALIFFLIPIISNVFEKATNTINQTQGIDFSQKYPMMYWINTHLPYLGAIEFVALIISLFAKPLVGGEEI